MEQSQLEIRRKTTGTWCGVPGCYSKKANPPRYNFYSLPADPVRKSLWLKAIKLNHDTKRLLICEKHFDRAHIRVNASRSRLVLHAVPTLHLPEAEPNEDPLSLLSDDVLLEPEVVPYSEKGSPNNEDDPLEHITSPEAAVKVEPLEPNTATSNLYPYEIPVAEKKNDMFSSHPNKLMKVKEEEGHLTVFVDQDNRDEIDEEMHFDNLLEGILEFENLPEVQPKSWHQKYTNDFKLFALKLYFKSPNAYKMFQRSFHLPRISTVYRFCIPTTTELNRNIIGALKAKVEGMTLAQKECVLCVGAISLNPTIDYDADQDQIFGFHEVDGVQTLEPASKLLVLTVRGLFHDWRQPLSYCFVSKFISKDLQLFVDKILQILLFDIGLNVRVLMSDLEANVLNLGKDRRVSVKTPFFFVGNKKIYFMYEPCHLMRNAREIFFFNQIVFQSAESFVIARWSHLMQCFSHDSKLNSFRLAPKLSEKHICEPKRGMNDDFKFTSEIFSYATASALSFYVNQHAIDSEAEATAQWVHSMSRLHNLLNFSKANPPEDKDAVFSGELAQVDFLLKTMARFSELLVISNDQKIKKKDQVTETSNIRLVFKDGFQITISALLLLYDDLKRETRWLPIVGLSHDCLDIFFKKCRLKHGLLPTAKQIVECIKTFPIFSIFQYCCKKQSPGDLEVFLSAARQMPEIAMYSEKLKSLSDRYAATTNAEFSAVSSRSGKKALEHLAVYLLYKGYRQHSDCAVMKDYVYSKDIVEHHGKIPFLGYRAVAGNVYTVPQEFMEFVQILEVQFKEYFSEHVLRRSISGLQSYTENIRFPAPCNCFPVDYIKHLYFKFKLFDVIRYNNNKFGDQSNRAAFVVNDYDSGIL